MIIQGGIGMAVPEMNRYNYQYGTEAPQYPYQVPTPEQSPSFEPLRRPQTQPKTKIDVFYTIKMALCGSILFASALSFVHLTSELSERQRELRQVTTQVRETQSMINSVQAIIASHLDLESIQTIAQEQLGMAEPLPHQVVYLELPQESYTIYND